VAPGGQAVLGASGPALLPNDRFYSQLVGAKATETAVFGDAEWAVTDRLTAGLGVRFYRTTSTWDINFSSPIFVNFGVPDPLVLVRPSAETGNTPKLSLKYRFNADDMVYALASRGYRFGGQNDLPPTPYKSDSLWNYEAGVRLSPNKDINLSFSLYRLDWKDAQVNVFEPTTGGTIVGNVGKAQVDGAEISAGFKAGDAWRLDAVLAYTDARTSVDFPSAGNQTVLAGARLPGTARLQSSLLATYRFGLAGLSGRASAAYSSVGERFNNIQNTQKLGAYETVDLRLALGSGPWEATLYANNATDRRAALGRDSQGAIYVNRPRTLGVSVRYDL
jgi:iron complex outermembrane recepter protein